MKKIIPFLAILALCLSACKVEFSPNAPWRDVPVVYCVLDPQEDTVWARVQHAYLSEGNIYDYSQISDSNYYGKDDIEVYLLAWKGIPGPYFSYTPSNQLVDRWKLSYTIREGKPEGDFPSGGQPVYYCVPGKRLVKDTDCVFQLVVVKTSTGDTIAQAYTTMVGFIRPTIRQRDTIEEVLIEPNGYPKCYGFVTSNHGKIRWQTLPRGRLYQPLVRFFYRKGTDTLSVDIPSGDNIRNEYNYPELTTSNPSQTRFLSFIKNALSDNTDSLFNVNYVDILIYACNEDLNAYITSLNSSSLGGQEYQPYTNIEGGVGVFGSRRSHIITRVACDSTGKEGYLPSQLYNLGVGFYGNFTPAK